MYKEIFTTYINNGNYNLDDLTVKLNKMYIEGNITEEERDELLTMAIEKCHDDKQVNLYEKIVNLEHRIVALETADIPVWTSGYTTMKGETVKFDYDNDGVLDLLRYDGGRASTSLSVGKIDGWHVVDSEGNILGTYYNGEFTPVE